VNTWAGAKLATDGHATTVYDLDAFQAYEKAHAAPFWQFRWYAYPPSVLLLTAPLALFGYLPAYLLWIITGTALCALVFARTMRWPYALLASVAAPAVLLNTIAGQNGPFTAALLAGGVLLLGKRPLISGVLFGLLCYKPQFAVLVPFALAADHRWRTIAAAAATAAAVIGLSIAVFGWEAWSAYLRVASINSFVLENGHFPDMKFIREVAPFCWYRMPTVFTALRSAGASVAMAYATQALSAAAALALVVAVWRGMASLPVKGAVLILGTLAATPYAWDYDLVVLTFAIVWLWQDAEATFAPWEKIATAATLLMTILFAPLAFATHLQFGPLLLWTALIFAALRAMRCGKINLEAVKSSANPSH
jgi:hypothetical protein